MRLCRYSLDGRTRAGFYLDDRVVELGAAAARYRQSTHEKLEIEEADDDLLRYLPPEGKDRAAAARLAAWLEKNPEVIRSVGREASAVDLRTPVPRPRKIFLLAGNYAEHIREGGGLAVARSETFPYVFMKPLSALNDPGAKVFIPAISPHHIDWEVELGVVIGKEAKRVAKEEALEYVAGYTVVDDISDRRFRPNSDRKEREKDPFFDWLHGKWHDGFCPVGPAILSAADCPDPQKLRLTLRVNGDLKQDATTAQQIFPVAHVIEFISSIATLESGDIISTGTPSGVGSASGTFLKPGDVVEASIETIGVLRNVMAAEQ